MQTIAAMTIETMAEDIKIGIEIDQEMEIMAGAIEKAEAEGSVLKKGES